MGVYAPSFNEENARVEKGLVGLGLLRHFLEKLGKNRSTVKELWVGEGVNHSRVCTEVTRGWMQNEVIEKMGLGLGECEGRQNWKKTNK